MAASAKADWQATQLELAAARTRLSVSPAGVVRQAPFDRVCDLETRCTSLVHGWLAKAFEMEPVSSPRLVFSLDVDGVLEDEAEGFSATGVTGAAAMRLLQLGGVAVLLNTARSLPAVQQRVRQFQLLGGVSAFGSVVFNAPFDREIWLTRSRPAAQLEQLRSYLRADPEIVLAGMHPGAVRASRITEGRPVPVTGPDARGLLDRHGLYELAFWVAPRYTDFVDRSVNKGVGLEHLRNDLRLSSLPLAAMGDGVCDLPMLRIATIAFLPAATLPSYSRVRGQRLMRSRFIGAQALWEAACALVPSAALQRHVLAVTSDLTIPEWLPVSLRQRPINGKALFPRLAGALAPRSHRSGTKGGIVDGTT